MASPRNIDPLSAETAQRFPDNTVVNSRYTVLDFIFKNLYEQFRRPLNFYFLLVAMLQFISIIAPVNPMSTLVPLLFAFSLTAVKEGYDDVKRHQQDTAYNNRIRRVLSRETGEWRQSRNRDICVGDVILLEQNDEIPCDCLVLAAPSSSVLIRTDNLDGEIDLKRRDVVAPRVELASPTRGSCGSPLPVMSFFSVDDSGPALLEKLACLTLRCPPPNAVVESFDGVAEFTRRDLAVSLVRLVSLTTATLPARPAEGGAFIECVDEVVKLSLSHKHLLPQSCLLKNTERAVCIAVYTGNDTKCGMNKRPPPVKWAQIDKDVSQYAIFIFCFQMLSAVSFGLAGFLMNNSVENTHWYLQPHEGERAASFIIYPMRFFLLTTVMIPVSFKFVVDVSKYYMAMAVEWDTTMIHGELGGCKVNNSGILEDLGQIDYVLSDKTGTMTQNVMELQYISVVPDFRINLSEMNIPTTVCASPTVSQAYPSRATGGSRDFPGEPEHIRSVQCTEVQHFAYMLALCNTVEVTPGLSTDAPGAGGSSPVLIPPGLDAPVSYQAASPDEIALCCGAAKLNVVLHRRTLESYTLRLGPNPDGSVFDETWQLHHVFLFSSERKAMGVIVEDKQRQRILVLVKGADDSVSRMLRLRQVSGTNVGNGGAPQLCSWQESYPAMAEHLHSYAKRGLRTLLVAQREISRDELHHFLQGTREAELAMTNRQERVDVLRTELETGLDLIGITAIEDKLQEQVQETISDVLSAGMMMWMLTGDKVETAEQIGLSCGLYGPQDRVIRIVEGATAETRDDWEQVLMHAELPPLPAGSADREAGATSAWQRWSMQPADEKQSQLSIGRRVIQGVRAFRVGCDLSGSEEGETEMDTLTPPPSTPTSHQRAVLVVQGGTVLERIFSSAPLAARFGDLSRRCVSVICARTTPSQKAMITSFVRTQGKMTLSIGDGGNDVAMIQEAHVGVGIVGKEGQQASRAADFAITQFSDLRQLLFVHGQQAYTRTAYVIKYSFYKSMLISFIQLAYNCFGTHVSGGTFWNSFSLTMWNGVYTLPQTLSYCLDRFAPRVVLERCPELYKLTRRSADMDVTEFFGWYVARGVVQSVALLYFVSNIFDRDFALPDGGHASSNDLNFTVAYTALILSQMITVFLESHSITTINALWLVGMPVFYLLSTLGYSGVPNLQYFGVLRKTLHVESWLAATGIAVVLTMPVVAFYGLREAMQPSSRGVLRSAELKRQSTLLANPQYRRKQPVSVRWFGCSPEAASPSLGTAAGTLRRGDMQRTSPSPVSVKAVALQPPPQRCLLFDRTNATACAAYQ